MVQFPSLFDKKFQRYSTFKIFFFVIWGGTPSPLNARSNQKTMGTIRKLVQNYYTEPIFRAHRRILKASGVSHTSFFLGGRVIFFSLYIFFGSTQKIAKQSRKMMVQIPLHFDKQFQRYLTFKIFIFEFWGGAPSLTRGQI